MAILSGAGTPENHLGVVDDGYFDTTNLKVYKKTDVLTWTLIDTYKGSGSVSSVALALPNIDWATGNVFTKTLGANTVFTFANAADGQTIVCKTYKYCIKLHRYLAHC